MTTHNDDLLPCPFCGSDAESGSGFSPLESVTWAWCSNAECDLHDIDHGFTPASWNRRPSTQPVEQVSDAKLLQDVKNALCIEGHLNAAHDLIMRSNSPDGTFNILGALARSAAEMGFNAALSTRSMPVVDSTDAEGDLRKRFEAWHDKQFPADSLMRHVAGYYALHHVNDRWKAVWAMHSAAPQPTSRKED